MSMMAVSNLAANGNLDLRRRFQLKKKPRSLQSKVPLVKEENVTIFESKLSRASSTPGQECHMHNAVMLEDVETLKQILEGGFVNIDNVGPNGFTALHRACTGGNLNIVKVLLEAGANLSLLNKDGKSALQLAAVNGHFEVSEFLIEKGAKDEEIKDGIKANEKS